MYLVRRQECAHAVNALVHTLQNISDNTQTKECTHAVNAVGRTLQNISDNTQTMLHFHHMAGETYTMILKDYQ